MATKKKAGKGKAPKAGFGNVNGRVVTGSRNPRGIANAGKTIVTGSGKFGAKAIARAVKAASAAGGGSAG